MARPTRTAQEQGYLRSFWDEAREMEADYRGLVEVHCSPTARPGIIQIRMIFTPNLSGKPNGLGSHAVTVQYPNASEQTLAGCLWATCLSLLALVEQDEMRQRPVTKHEG